MTCLENDTFAPQWIVFIIHQKYRQQKHRYPRLFIIVDMIIIPSGGGINNSSSRLSCYSILAAITPQHHLHMKQRPALGTELDCKPLAPSSFRNISHYRRFRFGCMFLSSQLQADQKGFHLAGKDCGGRITSLDWSRLIPERREKRIDSFSFPSLNFLKPEPIHLSSLT